MITLKERINHYERDISDTKLLDKLPVIIILNGRSFRKATSFLPKPFSLPFAEILCNAMIKLAHDVDGTVFTYSFNDEIIVIARNDQTVDTTPWYDNRVQKIVSAAASIATLELNKTAKTNDIPLLGEPIFTANTFVVPNIFEAMNLLISKQQQAYHTALYMATFYGLMNKYNAETARQALVGKSQQEKLDMLLEECNIDFDAYPNAFRKGFACYRIPKIITNNGVEEIRNKLVVDMDLPLFVKDKEFIENIFRHGHDVLRV